MQSLIVVGRKFFGICLGGLGVQQLIYAGFLPVILPGWPAWLPGQSICAYIFGVILIASGAVIVLERYVQTTALALGGFFLALVLFVHLLHLLFVNPYSQYLGTWTQGFKLLAISGGAFVVAGSYDSSGADSAVSKFLERLIPFGRIFFSITMIVFGVDHFLYVDMVATLVPDWIPGHIFWTYVAGAALIGSGVAIILRVQLKTTGQLLGLMIFLWFIVLHIPRAIADPAGNMGNEVTSAFQALGFSGIAWMIAFGKKAQG